MSPWFIVGVVAFLAGTVLHRTLAGKAYAILEEEPQRAAWREAFTRLRWGLLLPPVVLIGLFFVGVRLLPGRVPLLSALFWLGLLAFVAGNGVLTLRRLASAGLPAPARRYWALSQVARWSGLLGLFCGFFLQMRV
jgi:uncharacterized membrane protein YhaH (DUF805 family)